MASGGVFLLDEISLAEDSVLERLNSVLEPSRTVVLAERGGESADVVSITGVDGFQIVATMNPGGDYGKKELSPAMRNRFTEIWVPSINQRRDLETVADGSWAHDELRPFTRPLLDFVEWLAIQASDKSLISLRDILVRSSPCFSVDRLSDLLGRPGSRSPMLSTIRGNYLSVGSS
jgi:midasin